MFFLRHELPCFVSRDNLKLFSFDLDETRHSYTSVASKYCSVHDNRWRWWLILITHCSSRERETTLAEAHRVNHRTVLECNWLNKLSWASGKFHIQPRSKFLHSTHGLIRTLQQCFEPNRTLRISCYFPLNFEEELDVQCVWMGVLDSRSVISKCTTIS